MLETPEFWLVMVVLGALLGIALLVYFGKDERPKLPDPDHRAEEENIGIYDRGADYIRNAREKGVL